ncbi:MAG: hypothetical protein IJ604_09425 [Prevotella sp.]|nr:hypothetical protein [Prevotella sp.]
MKKTIIYLAACCLTILTTANKCDWEDVYEMNPETHSGKLAYDYVKENVNKHTDVLALIYHFNKYIQQESIEGRDSVDNLYFRNVKIAKEKNPTDGSVRYVMRSMPAHSHVPEYAVVVNEHEATHPLIHEGDVWDVQASAYSHGADTLFCDFHIVVSAENQWSVQSNSMPKYLFDHAATTQDFSYSGSAYSDSFTCRNKEWTVKWDDGGYFTHFEITAAGHLESLGEPKMTMEYRTGEPMNAYYVDNDYSVEPQAYLYGLVLWERKQYPYLTFWNSGTLDISIDDTISGTTDDMQITLNNDHINMKYMGLESVWQYW